MRRDAARIAADVALRAVVTGQREQFARAAQCDVNAAGRIFDCARQTVNYDTSHWYLWTARWTLGSVRITVTDTTAGRVVFDNQIRTGSKPYAPNPMVAYVGAPVGRAGPDDASVPRITVKNVWLSANPRPSFPN